jgi:hypothetical protein
MPVVNTSRCAGTMSTCYMGTSDDFSLRLIEKIECETSLEEMRALEKTDCLSLLRGKDSGEFIGINRKDMRPWSRNTMGQVEDLDAQTFRKLQL